MRHTRKDVTERTQREFRLLDRLVKRLKPADWRRRVPRPETKDPWTVQEALAHIIYWKQHSAHVFRGEKRPSEMRGLEVNQINALIYRRWRNRRPADVVAWHRRGPGGRSQNPHTPPDGWVGGGGRNPPRAGGVARPPA